MLRNQIIVNTLVSPHLFIYGYLKHLDVSIMHCFTRLDYSICNYEIDPLFQCNG